MKRAATTHDAYPLRTVTVMTGLSADLIRAWEKRHQVVTPVRGPRGARLYSAADIEHLQLLARAVGGGRAIGDVAALDKRELRLLATHRTAAAVSENSLQAFINHLTRFEHAALARALGDALLALGSSAFIYEIAVPLLHEVGRRWSCGEVAVAAEHLFSGVLRNLLSGLLQSRAHSGRSTMLLAAPAGERHDLGLLLVALLASDKGLDVLNFGADLPAAEIVTAARRCNAAIVGIGVVSGANRSRAVAAIQTIQSQLPAATELWLGGREARSVADRIKSFRGLTFDDLAAAEPELERIARHSGSRAHAPTAAPHASR